MTSGSPRKQNPVPIHFFVTPEMLFWFNIYIVVYSFFDKKYFKINFCFSFSLAKTTILVLVFPMY